MSSNRPATQPDIDRNGTIRPTRCNLLPTTARTRSSNIGCSREYRPPTAPSAVVDNIHRIGHNIGGFYRKFHKRKKTETEMENLVGREAHRKVERGAQKTLFIIY
jgi:hypothetical protein